MNLSSFSSSALLCSYSLVNSSQAEGSLKDIEEAIYLQRLSLASQTKLWPTAVPHEMPLRKLVLVRGVWNAVHKAQTQLTDRTTNALTLLAETVVGLSGNNGVSAGHETATTTSAEDSQPPSEAIGQCKTIINDTRNNGHNNDTDDLVPMDLIRALSLPPFANPLVEENEYDWSWLNGPSSSINAIHGHQLNNTKDTHSTFAVSETAKTINNDNVNNTAKRSRGDSEGRDVAAVDEEEAGKEAYQNKKLRMLTSVPVDKFLVSPPTSPPSPVNITASKEEEEPLLMIPSTPVTPPGHRDTFLTATS